jgi:sterol desaturase/sphingolipid hydroxylase (fatty acid hydroxylase superfamily)
MSSQLSNLAHWALKILAPGSTFGLSSLLSALAISLAWLAWRRHRRGRPLKAKLAARALFPAWLVHAPSARADAILFLFNSFPAVVMFGWALLSAAEVSHGVAHFLSAAFGPPGAAPWPEAGRRAVATLVLFLAYELAYWLDHWLSHHVPALWAFHKVHHTSEALTPLTVFRVHPVDTIVFTNITALLVGATGGVLDYGFGGAATPVVLSGTNIILVAFLFLTVHLQHSHIWISFTGPAHFNRNFGSCLAIWDWAFGTLYAPAARRERLTFGVGPGASTVSPHSVVGILLTPFAEALPIRWPRLRPVAARRMGAEPS